MANIIDAIINLIENPILELKDIYSEKNRMNSMGDALEYYIKDLFAGTFFVDNKMKRLKMLSNCFSYLGNNSNPPDAMLRGGDAIEIKKIESKNSNLALNSSYPKNKLFSNSSMISQGCRDAEKWQEKDIIYIVGVVNDKKLKHLCVVYGSDYCAIDTTYKSIKNRIHDNLKSAPNIELSETNELGRLNKVDPLGITFLRVRGMWGIENPWQVFDYVYERDFSKKFNFMCIINNEKWATLNNSNKLFALEDKGLKITDIKIKDPNNPAKLRGAKLIEYSIDATGVTK